VADSIDLLANSLTEGVNSIHVATESQSDYRAKGLNIMQNTDKRSHRLTRMKELKFMKDNDVITEEEFTQKVRDLLQD
jgi:hypothetical protein